MGGCVTCCSLIFGDEENFKQESAFYCFLVTKEEQLLNVFLTCNFIPQLLDSLDLPRCSTERRKKYVGLNKWCKTEFHGRARTQISNMVIEKP